MFNNERMKRLERRIEDLEAKESELQADLINKRILTRAGIYQPIMSIRIPCVPSIELEDLEKTQQRILDYLDIGLKTTPEKTELVKKEK